MAAAATNVTLTVNGEAVHLPDEEGKTLLRALRDDLRLTGTKNGCNEGSCGSCSVILNGNLAKSCLVQLRRTAGGRVVTIEGLGTPENPDPLQAAFVKHAASQCGACIPGIIVAAKHVLLKHPHPTVAEIKKGLGGNICRCTGYSQIIQAIQDAAAGTVGDYLGDASSGAVGRDLARKDALAKTCGTAMYADDMYLPGMVYGKVLRSAHPHALIHRIDTSRALALPGVLAVLTAKDVPGQNRFGVVRADQPVLCEDRVRFVGDAVAVVAAETPAFARQACGLIEVEYEKLPALTNPEKALRPDAPQIHEDGNTLCTVTVKRGADRIDRVLAEECDVVVTGTYRTPWVEHAYLEPEAVVAHVEEDGAVVVSTGSQNVYSDRRQIAAALGLPEERVRIVMTVTGGAFGGKEDLTVQIHAVLLAQRLHRPVKIVLSREESFICSTKKHPFIVHSTTGATRDGRIRAVKVRALSDTGPYASVGETVMTRFATHATGPYEVAYVDVEVTGVFTNNLIGGAMRGFGTNQAAYACEMQMDAVAERLGIDPVTLRLRNAVTVGSQLSTGQVLTHSVGLKETIARAAAAANWSWREPDRLRGVGVACGFKNVGLGHGIAHDRAGARLVLDGEGRLTAYVGAADNGQGLLTVVAQIAAEETGVSYHTVEVVAGDTTRTPYGGVSSASRQTFMTGNAVRRAAQALKETLLEKAAAILEVPPEILAFDRDAIVVQERPDQRITFAEVARRDGGSIEVETMYLPPPTHPLSEQQTDGYRTHVAYGYATHIAEVEVDPRTGRVAVKRVVAAHDVGKAIHPPSLEGQIIGGISMGQGYALSEQFRIVDGRPETLMFKDLRLPKAGVSPEVVPIIVEDPEIDGPYGAKGTGELSSIPTTPAILNAIYDATGVRITDLPATPDKILAGLRQRAKARAAHA